MCSTLEYANNRLKSPCPTMNTAAMTMDTNPKSTMSPPLKSPKCPATQT